jgi:hypothetical protein
VRNFNDISLRTRICDTLYGHEPTDTFFRGPRRSASAHTHAPSVIPFGVTGIPLRPIYHRAAFIALGVPVFEIREVAGLTDMLIRDPALGRALAQSIGDKPAVLMRGHGATVVRPPRLLPSAPDLRAQKTCGMLIAAQHCHAYLDNTPGCKAGMLQCETTVRRARLVFAYP